MKSIITFVIGAISGVIICTCANGRTDGETTIVHDTLTIETPTEIERLIVRTDTRYLRVAADTLRDTLRDTTLMLVEVPIEQKHYTDSSYEAWVSGYEPKLDSVRVFNTERTVYSIQRTPGKRRWGVGIQAGAGIGKQGVTPYVGIGVSYNLITF